MIATKEEAVRTIETAEAIEIAGVGKNGKESKSDKYPGNLVRALCICYHIIF